MRLPCPDHLAGSPDRAETVFQFVDRTSMAAPVILDMAAVRWIAPYGALSLLLTCRYLTQLTGLPVELDAIRPDVRAYLERIDLFDVGQAWIRTRQAVDPEFRLGRSESSINVMPLTLINSSADVIGAAHQLGGIAHTWLQDNPSEVNRLVSVLSEICSNACDHSGDVGYVMAQKYVRPNGVVRVEIAVVDMGMGIPKSLMSRYPDLMLTPGALIVEALNGRSSRPGRGGGGLDTVRNYVRRSGGLLFLRSTTGSVITRGADAHLADNLTFFPGTQVAVTLQSHL